MAFDVEDLTTFYANLPSIFESDPSTSIERTSNGTDSTTDSEKTYQPMFSSFLFADSEPFTKAAFVASTYPSIETKTTQEQKLDEDSVLQETNIVNSNHIQTTPLPSLAPVEDIDDEDEDDFDGIPIRHASPMIKKKLNGDSDSHSNHSEHNNLLAKFIHHVKNDHQNTNEYDDHDDDDDESLLNDFQDEQQENDAMTMPSLFKDIPDIDDLNEHDEDNDRIPFDHMDMLDESDSIRSSSPDSLLSSSHLRDEDDDDEEEQAMNDDDDVTSNFTR